MLRRFVKLTVVVLFLAGLLALTHSTQAQTSTPNPSALNRPDYNYTEANGCTRCHFQYNPDGSIRGPHMIEAVGVTFDQAKKTFSFSGNGWFASRHATSNYTSTQNTYCAKCHSPLQAKNAAEFKPGMSEPIPYGKVEGVTCAVCHPSHNSAVVLGRRLGIYQLEKDKATPEAYKVIHEGEEDTLCMNCHTQRHGEDNPAMELMYVAGVRCIDCHMAPYGIVPGTETHEHPVKKLFHDFKVASNLPFSCGVKGSMTHCHPEFGVESTLELIPYLKDQHKPMWGDDKRTKKLRSVVNYRKLWNELEAQYKK